MDTELMTIMTEVADKHGLEVFAMFAVTRSKAVTDARAEFYFRALRETKQSSVAISRMCGRDRSTIVHGAARYAFEHGLAVPRGHRSYDDLTELGRARRIRYGVLGLTQ